MRECICNKLFHWILWATLWVRNEKEYYCQHVVVGGFLVAWPRSPAREQQSQTEARLNGFSSQALQWIDPTSAMWENKSCLFSSLPSNGLNSFHHLYLIFLHQVYLKPGVERLLSSSSRSFHSSPLLSQSRTPRTPHCFSFPPSTVFPPFFVFVSLSSLLLHWRKQLLNKRK